MIPQIRPGGSGCPVCYMTGNLKDVRVIWGCVISLVAV